MKVFFVFFPLKVKSLRLSSLKIIKYSFLFIEHVMMLVVMKLMYTFVKPIILALRYFFYIAGFK